MTNETTLDNRLREHGLKPTTPRLLVLQVLVQSAIRHWDAEALYQRLVASATPLGLTTVYKVLAQFEQVGLVQRRELRLGKRVYELVHPNGAEHGHLVCLQSRRMFEFDMGPLSNTLAAIAANHGLILSHVVLTAYGAPRSVQSGACDGLPQNKNKSR